MKKMFIGAILAAYMCTPLGSQQVVAQQKDNLKGEISLSGAFALYPMVVKWAEEFKKIHPNVRIDISGGGAGKGMTDALAKVVDLGMVSRDIHDVEIKKGAFAFAVIKDAVVPTINANNPVMEDIKKKGLSREVALKLWNGEYETWGQVLGTDSKVPVHVYTRSDACGAAETWAAWFDKRHQEYCQLIRDVFDEYRQVLGAEKIRTILIQRGHQVSAEYISQLMREMGLSSVRSTAKKEYLKLRETERKKNILQQQFTADQPNQRWVSDVTCFKLRDHYFYICVIIDLFSRKVIAHKISKRNSTQLITAAFKMAYEERQPPSGLIFHSDRGSQYTSHRLQQLLHKHNVEQSFSQPGKPHDNAVAESFFASLKKEELYRKDHPSDRAFQASVASYIEFYNTKRPHRTLKNLTPCQMEESCCATVK